MSAAAVEVQSEVAALRARLGQLENGLAAATAPPASAATFNIRVGEQQHLRWLARRARAAREADAREGVRHATRRERAALERRREALAAERRARLEQHERGRLQIEEKFGAEEREIDQALAELRARADQAAADAGGVR